MIKERTFFSQVLSGSSLIAGTAIGAGMLGIPLVTSKSGFYPGVVMTLVVWLFMLITGFLLLEATLWMKERTSFLSLANHFLGKTGRWIVGALFIFLYGSLMVAYFAAGVPLFADFLSFVFSVSFAGAKGYLLFAFLFGLVVAIGPKSIDRVNLLFTFLMVFFWILLISIGAKHVETIHLKTKSILTIWMAAPILFGAFGYHNMIPSLVIYFHRDRKVLRYSILFGTLIPCLVYLFWQWLMIGAIGKTKILATTQMGLPITYALKEIVQNGYVLVLGQLFAFFAVITSTLGVAFSLIDFLADGFHRPAKGSFRLALTLFIFGIPMLFSMIDQTIFEKALGVAGGYGEAFLNGLFPIFIYFIGRYQFQYQKIEYSLSKKELLLLAVFCFIVIFIETLQLMSKN